MDDDDLYCKVYVKGAADAAALKALLAALLNRMQASGLRVVASCNFEDALAAATRAQSQPA